MVEVQFKCQIHIENKVAGSLQGGIEDPIQKQELIHWDTAMTCEVQLTL